VSSVVFDLLLSSFSLSSVIPLGCSFSTQSETIGSFASAEDGIKTIRKEKNRTSAITDKKFF
jgi:hypothetical protein